MAVVINVFPERASIRADGRKKMLVAVELAASGAPVEAERAACACALAIDVSGSMAGPPLAHVVASVERLVGIVGATDALGAVAFSEDASVVAPVAPMDETGRRVLRTRMARLRTDGWTNVERGITGAAELLRDVPPGVRRGIVLLSDGAPNRGATTIDALTEIVRGLRPNITVSTLGYGVDHQEDILSAIAEAGGGRYQFVQDPALAQRELALALGSQGDTVACDIAISVKPASGVDVGAFTGKRVLRFGEGGVSTALSDMIDGATQLVVFELSFERPPPKGLLASITLRYRDAAGQAHEVAAPAEVDVRLEDGEIVKEAHARILVARSEDVRRASREQADRGQFEGAGAMLRAFLAEIEASPAFVAGDGSLLWEVHENMLDEAMAFERRPSQEAYSILRKQMTSIRLDKDDLAPPSRRAGPQSGRFVTMTSGKMPNARVVFLNGPDAGKIVALGLQATFGRTAHAEVPLHDASVSRRHAEIFTLEGDHYVCDLGSTNTTTVNGKKLDTRPHTLHSGDVIAIGQVQLRYLRDP